MKRITNALLWIVFLFYPLQLVANSLVVTEQQAQYSIKPFTQVYADASNQVTIAQVMAGEISFVPAAQFQQRPNHNKVTYWARLSIENMTAEQAWFLSFSYARLPVLELYRINNGHAELLESYSPSSPFSERAVQQPLFYSPLQIPPQSRSEFIIKYQTFANAPPNIRLHSRDNFQRVSERSTLLNGILVGVISAILVSILINLCFNPNRTNIYYSVWTALFLLIVIDMSGFTFQYFWPSQGEFTGLYSLVLMVTVPIFHLLFVREFLLLRKFHTLLDRIYLAVIVAYAVLIAAAIMLDSVLYNMLLSIMTIPLLFYTALWCFKQQNIAIKVFGISVANHLIFVNILTIFGANFGNFFEAFNLATYIKVGYLIEGMLFSVALALQYKSVQTHLLSKLQNQVAQLNLQVVDQKSENQISQMQLDDKTQQLFSDLSHELRTPLTVMKFEVESLQHNVTDDVQGSYQGLMGKIDGLTDLINRLSDFSKDSNMQAQLDTRRYSVTEFSHLVIHAISESTINTDHHIELINELESDKTLNLDAQKLIQVVKELLNNSWQFRKDDENHTTRLMLIDSRERGINIIVEDNGKGVDSSELDRIFEPLYRVEKSRNRDYGGAGLGLALCKRVVEAHSGSINATTNISHGLSVSIWLPYAETALDELRQA